MSRYDWTSISVPREHRMLILAALDLFAHCLGHQDNSEGRAPTAAAWARVPGALIHALAETGLLRAHRDSYEPSFWFKVKMLESAEWFLCPKQRKPVELVGEVFGVEV